MFARVGLTARRWPARPAAGRSRCLGGLAGPALPPAAGKAAAAAGYPDGSASQQLLERCLEEAVARGTDLAVAYEPYAPVDMMQTLLIEAHDFLGCSWLTAIVAACIGIRLISLPISISAIRSGREKALIQPQFMEITERQKAAVGNQKKMDEVNQEHQDFVKKHGRFWMLKGTGNMLLVQLPLYITAFHAMRGFAAHPDVFRSFAMEAPLWLDSLALADPYAVLPAMTAAIMITNTELFGSIDTDTPDMAQKQQTNIGQVAGVDTFQKYRKWIFRGSAVMFLPFTWNFPAGVFVFMSTNMVVATLQNRLLRLPTLERLLELPDTPEKVKAAAAAAKPPPVPALLPLGETIPRLLVAPANGATHRERAPEAASSPLRPPGPRGFLDALRAQREASEALQSSPLAQLQVSPQYAVERSRPL